MCIFLLRSLKMFQRMFFFSPKMLKETEFFESDTVVYRAIVVDSDTMISKVVYSNRCFAFEGCVESRCGLKVTEKK